jgi:hypothetical protein
MQRTKRDCITSAMSVDLLDQLRLVPSGGDSGPRGISTERTFFFHDIRVQLRVVTIRAMYDTSAAVWRIVEPYATAVIRQHLSDSTYMRHLIHLTLGLQTLR